MRTQVVAGVVIAVPVLLIGARLVTQQWALSGPPGGSATIEGDRVSVSAKIGARLISLEVHEGDRVEAGQLLATLDCSEPQAALDEARARLQASMAQANAAMAQAEAAGVQTSSAWVASQAAAAQADAVSSQSDAASRQAERVAALDDGTSKAALDQSATSADALSHQSLAAQAQAQVARLQVGMAKGQAAAAAANAQAAAEQVRAVEASVSRAELAVAECKIEAPRSGIVETLAFEIGELVGPGMPVAALVDLHEVSATFYLPNAELGGAKVGQTARVEADAWPGRAFDGRVVRVGPEAAFTPRNVQTRTDRDRLVYPVEIEIPNAEELLRPGMPVQVTLREQ
ncbi:MAG: efflux RND transporter periplasmic adaptor subunit [Myxococcota bacterium]